MDCGILHLHATFRKRTPAQPIRELRYAIVRTVRNIRLSRGYLPCGTVHVVDALLVGVGHVGKKQLLPWM